jgi:hypothetical protein
MQTSGRLVDVQRSASLALSGRAVLAARECTRDAEWRLLRCALRDSASSAQVEVVPFPLFSPALSQRAVPCLHCATHSLENK